MNFGRSISITSRNGSELTMDAKRLSHALPTLWLVVAAGVSGVLWSQQGHADFHPLMLAMAMLPVQITSLVLALGRAPRPWAGDQGLKVR